ncbi:MAG TPA: hypothetical protein VMV91_07515 [Rhodocyclaceae bacterium]|nr:hypothetical protein [Rhodocyclaceae bacterium]
MKTVIAVLVLAAASGAALANPPAPSGHPPMGAADMSKSTAPLTQTGKVVSVLDAKQFTYLEVKNGGKTRWVVSPAIAAKAGDTVHYANGQVMTKFHSKLLNRDFTDVLFTTHAVVGK